MSARGRHAGPGRAPRPEVPASRMPEVWLAAGRAAAPAADTRKD